MGAILDHMALPIPSTLTPTHARNPYRTVKHSTLGYLTILERSFALGDFDQIEYWFERGVVQEALAGQTPSRRDLGRNLMDCLGAWIKANPQAAEYKRAQVETAVEALWFGGGHTRKEAWAGWLSLMPDTVLADRLLDEGVDPWKRPRWEEEDSPAGSDKRVNVQLNLVARPAIIEALDLLATRQASKYRTHYENTALIGRIDRMLNQADMPIRLNAALEGVIRGGLLARTHYHMREQAMQGQFPQEFVTCWERWRDQLLARGATIELSSNGGFLNVLASCAPHRPLERWDVPDLLEVARKAQQPTQDPWQIGPGPKNEREILLDVVGRRGLSWERWVHAWMDHLLPTLPQYTEDGVGRNTSTLTAMDKVLPQLLDAPGGTALVTRIMGAIKAQGYPRPWDGGLDLLARTRWLVDWVSHDGFRSQRRIKQLLELDQNETFGRFSLGWRNQLAKQFLGCAARNAKDLDTTPGLMLESDRAAGYDRRKIEAQILRVGHGKSPKAPTATEISLLLDLAGPEIVQKEQAATLRNMTWMGELLQALPWRWEDARTPAKERRAVLDLLAQRQVLQLATDVFEPLDCVADRVSEARNNDVMATPLSLDIAVSWFMRWTKTNNNLLGEMDQALARLGRDGQQQRARLHRGAAWVQIMYYPSELVQGIPDTFMGQALAEEVKNEPRLLDLAAGVAELRLSSNTSSEWVSLEGPLNVLRSAQVLGWTGSVAGATARHILEAAVRCPGPTEDQIYLVWDVLSHNPNDRTITSGQFLVGLLAEESAKGRSMLAWGSMAERLVEASGWDMEEPDGPAELGTLLGVVMAGRGRKTLRQLAQDTLQRDLPTPHAARPARRF